MVNATVALRAVSRNCFGNFYTCIWQSRKLANFRRPLWFV